MEQAHGTSTCILANRTLQFLNIKNSVNTNQVPADVRLNNCTDSLGNVNWIFANPSDFTWVGLGADNLWSNAANWQGGVVPTGTTVAISTSVATRNCSITAGVDLSGTGGGIDIGSGYTGTISLNGNTMSIGSGAFTLAGGVFNAGSGAMNIAGDFIHNGGIFTAGTSTVIFNGNTASAITGTADTAFYTLSLGPAVAATSKTTNAARNRRFPRLSRRRT